MENHITQVHNIKSEDLIKKFDSKLEKRISDLEERLQSKKPSEYLTRKDVASLLGVSLVTIHEWCKKEILKPFRIGNRVRFKRSEIEEVLEASR